MKSLFNNNTLQIFICLILFPGFKSINAQCPQIVWQDNFENDLSQWNFIVGDGCDLMNCGWGQNELQYYTEENVFIEDECLIIESKNESIGIGYYSSGFLVSKASYSLSQGYIEVKVKLPSGQGYLANIALVSDMSFIPSLVESTKLVKYLGGESNTITGEFSFEEILVKRKFTSYGNRFDDTFYVLGYSWDEDEVNWYVDGYNYATIKKSELGLGPDIEEDSFRIALALPIGGLLVGNPNSTTLFPDSLHIDYIRLFDSSIRPNLVGKQKVFKGEKNVEYKIDHALNESSFLWEVPDDFEVTSTLDKRTIQGNWKNKGGLLQCQIVDNCEDINVSLEVLAEDGKIHILSLENFDDDALIEPSFSTGILEEDILNSFPSEINDSQFCGKYHRNDSELYDVLFYETASIKDAEMFTSGIQVFDLDVYTEAAIGTQIILQLENNSIATSDNFPLGRHSRYVAYTTSQSSWQRLSFEFIDRLDTIVGPSEVNNLVFLFGSNSYTDHIFYFDNFDIYGDYISDVENPISMDASALYPNPVHKYFTIKSENEILELVLYDISGNFVKRFEESISVDVEDLDAGLYFIDILYVNKAHEIKKIIKVN